MKSDNNFLDLSLYEPLYRIGAGGFSQVYLIEDENKQQFAAKVSDSELNAKIKDYQSTVMLFREISLMSLMNHPSILKFIGYSPTDFNGNPHPTIITELAINKSLFDMIETEKSGSPPAEWNDTTKLIIIYGIASGMSYLHSNQIIHRDLKTKNILLNEFFHPLISDFGLSKTKAFISKSMNLKSGSGIKGTIKYMAPEIFSDGKYSYASDVYAFALVIFDIFSVGDESFFKDFNIFKVENDICNIKIRPKINENVPVAYRNLIENCWSQRPEVRPSFDQIIKELKTNKDFITDQINEKDFHDYINYIETYKTSFDVSNRSIHFDSFLNHEQKQIRKRKRVNINSIHIEPNHHFSELKNPIDFDISCPLKEIERIKSLERIRSEVKSLEFPASIFEKLNVNCQDAIREAQFDRNKLFFVGKSLVEGTNDFPKNVELGIEYLKKSNTKKCRNSIIYYIEMLVKGGVIQKDYKEAEKIIKEVAVDDIKTQFLKGKICRHNKNFEKASLFYKKAANEGDDESMYQLAKMLFLGECKKKNKEDAFYYFNQSVQNGYKKSILFIAALNKLTKMKGFKRLSNETQYYFIKILVNHYKNRLKTKDSVPIVISTYQIEKFFLNSTLQSYNFHRFLCNFDDISIEVKFPSPSFKLILNLLFKIKVKVPAIKIGIIFYGFQSIFPKICFSKDISYHGVGSSIPKRAFQRCFLLNKIIIHPNVSSIGFRAFYQCTSLTQINIPSSVTEIKEFTFYGCTKLTQIIIPNSVTELEMSCFEGCSSLYQIELSPSIKIIGPAAFRSCSSLKEITLPSSITEIDYSTFENCYSLKNIIIPSSVLKIDEFAFVGCSSLMEIHIPSSVEYIEKNAFSKGTKIVKEE